MQRPAGLFYFVYVMLAFSGYTREMLLKFLR